MKTLLHVGYPKCGSGFLQKEVFPRLPINVISSEYICGNTFYKKAHYGLLDRYDIIKAYKNKYPNAYVLLIIRDRDELIDSLYSQSMRNRYSYSYNEYVTEILDKELLDFDKYIIFLNTLWDNVLVLDFKDFKVHKHKFIKDICNFVGIQNVVFDDVTYNKRFGKMRLFVNRYLNSFYWNFKKIIN